MTLTAYLSLLSLGSSIENRTSPDSPETEPEEIQRLHRIANAVSRAQVDVITSVSRYGAPIEERELKENLAGGMLTVGTMVVNYIFCFPVVGVRHRLQAFSTPYAWRTHTPMYCAGYLWDIGRRQGIGGLYAGFGMGLLGQAVTGGYESVVNNVILRWPWKNDDASWIRKVAFRLLSAGLHWCISIPLYPFYRNALILRVQPASPVRLITSVKDFVRLYKTELARFIGVAAAAGSRRRPPLISVFVPSCILNYVTESMLMFLYKRMHRIFMFSSSPNNHSHHHHPRRRDWARRRAAVRRALAAVEEQEQQRTGTATSASSAYNPELDSMAEQILTSRNNKEERSILRTYYPEIAAGIISSMIARAIIYPVDTVLFKLMLQDTGLLVPSSSSMQYYYDGFFDCVLRTWRDEGGWRAFCPGWGAGVLEIVLGYAVLEASWLAYRIFDWRLSSSTWNYSLSRSKRVQEHNDTENGQ